MCAIVHTPIATLKVPFTFYKSVKFELLGSKALTHSLCSGSLNREIQLSCSVNIVIYLDVCDTDVMVAIKMIWMQTCPSLCMCVV